MLLATALLLALLLDAWLGDPAIPAHPVRLLGRLALALEKLLYRPDTRRGTCKERSWHLGTGLLLALLLPTIAVSILWLLFMAADRLGAPWEVSRTLGAAFVLYVCIAFRDLFDHARPIVDALERPSHEHVDLEAAQDAVQRIVGRDARLLDQHGVARAAIESVAESLADGLTGPMVWYTVAGLTASLLDATPASSLALAASAALVFRAVNTLDSMVGYRNERYLYFGRASARFDDLLGLLPSRLSILFLAAAALMLRLDVAAALRIWRRDGGKHPSPNAGQSESFVAGALGLQLGGPTTYRHGISAKDWLGEGRREANATDLRRACRLVRWAGYWGAGTCALLVLTLPFLTQLEPS